MRKQTKKIMILGILALAILLMLRSPTSVYAEEERKVTSKSPEIKKVQNEIFQLEIMFSKTNPVQYKKMKPFIDLVFMSDSTLKEYQDLKEMMGMMLMISSKSSDSLEVEPVKESSDVIKGEAFDGAEIKVFRKKKEIAKGTADEDGTFEIPVGDLKEGEKLVVKAGLKDNNPMLRLLMINMEDGGSSDPMMMMMLMNMMNGDSSSLGSQDPMQMMMMMKMMGGKDNKSSENSAETIKTMMIMQMLENSDEMSNDSIMMMLMMKDGGGSDMMKKSQLMKQFGGGNSKNAFVKTITVLPSGDLSDLDKLIDGDSDDDEGFEVLGELLGMKKPIKGKEGKTQESSGDGKPRFGVLQGGPTGGSGSGGFDLSKVKSLSYSFRPGFSQAVIIADGNLTEKEMNAKVIKDGENGNVYIPIRYISELYGLNVQWNRLSREVILSKDGETVTLNMEKGLAYDGYGNTIHLAAPKIMDGTSMISVNDLASILGVEQSRISQQGDVVIFKIK